MGLLKVIEWEDDSNEELVYKFPMKGNVINRGSALTVRTGQVAVFCDKGRMGDVFEPGFYKLDTNSLPVITKLMSWKYGFETPFKSDVYFVNTRQFPNQKWGTSSPIMIRDKDYGAVRVRSFGTYSIRVSCRSISTPTGRTTSCGPTPWHGRAASPCSTWRRT